MTKNTKKQIYKSMKAFEMEFFPKSFEKRMTEKTTEAQDRGVNFAKKSLERIRGRLAR